MKKFLSFTILIIFFSCSNNKKNNTASFVYVAGCDSIFYNESGSLNFSNIKGSKKDDSAFIDNIIKTSSKKTIFIKPFGGYCGGTAETTTNLAMFFVTKKINALISMPDSTEEKFFNDISLEKAAQIIMAENGGIKLSVPKEDYHETLKTKPEATMTIILSGDEQIFYYTGKFNNQLIRTTYDKVGKSILGFKKQVKPADLMFLIKLVDCAFRATPV